VALVLVTGGSGGVGRRLIPLLRSRGWRVRCLVHERPVPGADETVAGSLEDEASLARAVDGADAVLHLAAVSHARSGRTYERTNHLSTRRLTAAARNSGGARFVLAGSRIASRDRGPYALSKLRAEEAVRDAGAPFVIVRLPEVIGLKGRDGPDRIIARALRGQSIPIPGKGEHVICPAYVDDVLTPLALALESEAAIGHTYTLAGECVSVREFSELCVEVFGSESRVRALPMSAIAALGAAARALPLPIDPDLAARLSTAGSKTTPESGRDLGFAPRPLREALRTISQEANAGLTPGRPA
jgi:nucleoside-diphosphate-sugar epimerase